LIHEQLLSFGCVNECAARHLIQMYLCLRITPVPRPDILPAGPSALRIRSHTSAVGISWFVLL
jgi:hypothetical protein